ncbi:GHMP kinase [Methanocella sp. CWC-04]|uniref:Beta-ribofuranosylaminobenzene 5'-phosphate synthase n=1 Tax=Methanooceanicella nereidis TaxID=2052831 RepID=A0AAP2RGC3_9EURY|nr:beta-ribofuranosylaminobenzene 5'-phosphate synthase [Methanocella sp. CWC-04]MCD1295742.1 GHMP kinase [Methanocella sp. CWC-04]
MKFKISTPSRLHFGLIDFNGDLGRIDGGTGVSLSNPGNVLSIRRGKSFQVNGSNPKLIQDIAQNICNKLNRPLPDMEITVEEEIPSHAGFGSKTQMSLALAYAICREYGISYTNIDELSRLVGRGGTSGIGVRAFDRGGFILDCGHSFGKGKEKSSCMPSSASKAKVSPQVLRCDVPEDWRFVLVTPLNYEGSHGKSEVDIFESSFPLNETETNKICRVILMQLVPGILEKDIATFGKAINTMQNIGFKNVEVQLKSPLVPNLLSIMNNAGSYGSGMSSFGPTVFGLTDNDNDAIEIRKAVTEHLDDMDTPYVSWITGPNNHGFTVLDNAEKAESRSKVVSQII